MTMTTPLDLEAIRELLNDLDHSWPYELVEKVPALLEEVERLREELSAVTNYWLEEELTASEQRIMSTEREQLAYALEAEGEEWRRAAELLREGGWRPIEEAPKDGTEVLLLVGAGPVRAAVVGRWLGRGKQGWANSWDHGPLPKAFYFMPLPAPPEGEG